MAAGPEDDELTESLLHGGDEQQQESIGQTVDTPRGRRGAIIVYPGPFNLESFLRQIFAWWHQLIGVQGNTWIIKLLRLPWGRSLLVQPSKTQCPFVTWLYKHVDKGVVCLSSDGDVVCTDAGMHSRLLNTHKTIWLCAILHDVTLVCLQGWRAK